MSLTNQNILVFEKEDDHHTDHEVVSGAQTVRQQLRPPHQQLEQIVTLDLWQLKTVGAQVLTPLLADTGGEINVVFTYLVLQQCQSLFFHLNWGENI